MGIYNGHTIQYLFFIYDKVDNNIITNKLKENNIYLEIRQNEKTNERYIALTILNTTDKRLYESQYYKENYIKWMNDYRTYIKKCNEPIDVNFTEEEQFLLNKILKTIPFAIEKQGWYDENDISTTYGL